MGVLGACEGLNRWRQAAVTDNSHPGLWQPTSAEGHGRTGEGGTRAGQPEALSPGSALSEPRGLTEELMERVCDPSNLNEAYFRVVRNKGSAGVDGMTVEDLRPWIKQNKSALISSLLAGTYRPSPVRGVKIPKPGKSESRQLGIPTVVDRLVQQAILQVLQPILDPKFSDNSFGFRPGRGAHDALARASQYVQAGYTVVVDIDLEKFFDRANHDMLLARLARHVKDKRLLRIVRHFVEAGLLSNGVLHARSEGTPQGGPLSPLLANLLLDDLDKELEKRGHRFVRYADDCNIYVQSERAGERVMSSLRGFIEKRLKLRVNKCKSAVAPIEERKFLGHRVFGDGSLGIAPESLTRLKNAIREHLRRNRPGRLCEKISRLNLLVVGWVAYYRYADSSWHLDDLDKWIRRKLRCVKLKQLKRASGIGRFLMSRGLPRDVAWRLAGSSRGWWRMSCSPQSHRSMPVRWFGEQGLKSLVEEYGRYASQRNRRGAEQACPVV